MLRLRNPRLFQGAERVRVHLNLKYDSYGDVDDADKIFMDLISFDGIAEKIS